MVSFLTIQDVIRPNHITCFRFVIGLFLIFFFHHLSYLYILILVAFGALSDFFDGALARAASKKTRLGMMIDPLADKFLVFTIVYILLTRKAIDPLYLFLMLIMEAHLVLIPFLSWIYSVRMGRKGRDRSCTVKSEDRVFIVKSKEIVLGKIKFFLYAAGLLSILVGKAIDSTFFSTLSEWLLISGLVAGAIALCTYLFRWFMRPHSISLDVKPNSSP